MKLMKIEKAVLLGLVITIMASAFSGFSVFASQCGDIRGRVLRLHILANSNTVADQQLKLNVRDKILSESQELFANAKTKKQAETSAREKMPEIIRTAQDEVYREGYDYKVRGQVVNMYFSTRTYGKITLPAGYYDAVRLTIGKAEGHNWWCVLFPKLCVPACEGEQKKQISDVLTPGETNIVENYGSTNITIKFKVVEMFEQADEFLKSHGINF